MPFEEVKKVWMNGRLVDFADAKIHVLTHAIHYGSGIFEGMRCYQTRGGSAVFRLNEHARRLYDSARIYRMEIPYSFDEFRTACIDVIQANEFKDCYIRPLVYRGFHSLGVNPSSWPDRRRHCSLKWGKYLGADALEQASTFASRRGTVCSQHPSPARQVHRELHNSIHLPGRRHRRLCGRHRPRCAGYEC